MESRVADNNSGVLRFALSSISRFVVGTLQNQKAREKFFSLREFDKNHQIQAVCFSFTLQSLHHGVPGES